jgi:phage recombination protein Bet
MNELAVIQKEQRLAQAPTMEFSSVQIQLLRDTIAQGCDPNEFALFLEIAKLKRLDPFNGQIRPVKRWDSNLGREKMTVQVGIDGYRVIGSRTGDLAGIDDATYDSEDGDHPKWARVTVYRYGRGDEKVPYTATARWGEYVQKKKDGTPNSMWLKMPFLMLGKVAEALALRKAFPDELSGIYTNEEMAQADNVIEGQPQPQEKKQPVSMPTATTEKKTELFTAEGVITARKDGKDNALWLVLGENLLAVPADKVGAHPFTVGDKLVFSAIERTGKERAFWVLQSVEKYEAAPVGDVLPPIPDGHGEPRKPDEMDKALAEGKFDEQPIGTLEETRQGKVGKKRQVRLWTLMSANKAKTGLTEKIVHQILDAMEPPIDHLENLDMGMYKTFEDIMTGMEDWKQFIE